MKVILSKLKNNFSKLFKIDKEDTDLISFFRIAIGSLILLFLSVLPDFDLLYGMNSVIPTDIHILFRTNDLLYYNEIIDFLNKFFSDRTSLLLYKLVFILSCLFIIVGLYSQRFVFVLLIINTALIKSSGYYTYGVDYFISMSLLYIILYPSDNYYSLRTIFRKLPPQHNTNFLL